MGPEGWILGMDSGGWILRDGFCGMDPAGCRLSWRLARDGHSTCPCPRGSRRGILEPGRERRSLGVLLFSEEFSRPLPVRGAQILAGFCSSATSSGQCVLPTPLGFPEYFP